MTYAPVFVVIIGWNWAQYSITKSVMEMNMASWANIYLLEKRFHNSVTNWQCMRWFTDSPNCLHIQNHSISTLLLLLLLPPPPPPLEIINSQDLGSMDKPGVLVSDTSGTLTLSDMWKYVFNIFFLFGNVGDMSGTRAGVITQFLKFQTGQSDKVIKYWVNSVILD